MKDIVTKIYESYALMGNRFDSKSNIYKDFMKHKLNSEDPLGKKEALKLIDTNKYKEFYKCSGLWNNYCEESTKDGLINLVDWMAACNAYESTDGKKLFIHGFSESDMW